jgi:tetratricopeptide (TPR) repeat protein
MRTPAMHLDRSRALRTRRNPNPQSAEPPDVLPPERADAADGLQAELSRLETLFTEGRYEDAITLGDSILEFVSSAQSRGKVLLFLAISNFQLARIQAGEQRLTEARKDLDTAEDPVLLVECMTTEAFVAQLKQRPDAVLLAEQALDACRKLDPIPSSVEVRVLNALAGAHLAAGAWESAISYSEEAIERAGPLFEMRRQAQLASIVSIACRELGQLDRSIQHATRSVELNETLRDLVPLARAENNLGWALIARGDLRSARKHLNRSLDLHQKTHLEAGRSHVLLSLCELNLADHHYTQAREFAQQALVYAERLGEASTVAQAHIWLGRVAASLSEPDVADSEFERAIDQLTRIGEAERLLRCHVLYAETLERRGELHRAYEQMKAAVSGIRHAETSNDRRRRVRL